MREAFVELHGRRREAYAKKPSDERFLRGLNEALVPLELAVYEESELTRPIVLIAGLPRSGTTLLSQLLAYCLDAGYVTNVAARFWLAPVHGIRISRLLAGEEPPASFESDHARTSAPTGIHEFGYFWRHWLRTETFKDVVCAADRADELDWAGLRRTLANVQHEFGRPLVAKNVLGVPHAARLVQELGPVFWVEVARDPLDVAVSILEARRAYYGDESVWWGTAPPEVGDLLGLDAWEQIAGQVHHLERLHARAATEVGRTRFVRVTYETLARDPASVLDVVRARTGTALRRTPPASFPFRRHEGRTEDKARFASLLACFAEKDST